MNARIAILLMLTTSLGALSRAVEPETKAMENAVEARVLVQSDRPGTAISSHFLGLSFETSTLTSQHFSPTNQVFRLLLANLGGGVLRFGGNFVEHTFWSREAGASFPDAKAVLGPGDLDRLFAFSRGVEWPVILGLNLGASMPEMAADEAAYAVQAGGAQLLAFEIGNEPELYRKNGVRGTNYVYSDYRRELDVYRGALHARLKKVPLCGPAHASNFGWLTNFLNDARSDVVLASRHHYPMSADPSFKPDNPRYASLDNLLSAATMKASAKLIREHQQAASKMGVPLRLGETNTASRGGKAGVSDSFASALWAVDYLFTTAELGVDGVNFHAYFRCGGYTPVCWDAGTGYRPLPLYYGLLMFKAVGGGRPLPVTCETSANLAAHAVLAANGEVRVILVNKERDRPVRVLVDGRRTKETASLLRLSAPALESTGGILLGGAAVLADGTWRAGNLESTRAAGKTFEILVPAASAVAVFLDPGSRP